MKSTTQISLFVMQSVWLRSPSQS